MKVNGKNNKWLLRISFSAFIFSVVSFFAYAIYSYNFRVDFEKSNLASSANGNGMVFGPYCRPDYFPIFLFFLILITGFIFFASKRTKLLHLAFFLIDTTFFFLLYSSTNLFKINENTEAFGVRGYEILFADEIRLELTIIICVSILFFCQIGFHLRMLLKTLQRKNRLP